MNISIIAPAFPYRGGIAQSTEILVRKLADRGHRVQLLNFKRQYPNILFPGKTQFVQDLSGEPSVRGERLVDSIGPHTWYRAYRKIIAFDSDVLIFRYWMPFFAPMIASISWLLKRHRRTKTLMICDNVIPHERRPGDLLLTRLALSCIDHFIPLSDFVKQDLLKVRADARTTVVPHPVYESFGQSIAKEEARARLGISAEKAILFFGYVRAYKGLDIAIRALPEILTQLDVKLMIVGEFYESEQKYRELIRDAGVEEHVWLHSEFVRDDDVHVYFSAADVLVLPYRSATQSGIVQLAYQLEKPCIVTDVGGLAEVVLDGKSGFVVPPGDPQAIAAAVVRFYREEKEKPFVQNVQREKRKYSWSRLVEVIESIAGGK